MKSLCTNILFIGAGHAGHLLLKLFSTNPSIQIVGIVDKDPEAPGMLLAKEYLGDFQMS